MDISSLVEWSAVGFGLAYLVLAMREHIACWAMALISTCLFLWLFWQAKLMMESALQVYYIAMAVYGWWQWRGGNSGTEQVIQTLNIRQHLLICSSVALLTLGSGFWLSAQTEAVQPFLDSFTTWGSIITTVLVANKVLENWLYWIVIDIASMILYANSGLWVTVILFALYVVLAVLGYAQWRKHLASNSDHSISSDA